MKLDCVLTAVNDNPLYIDFIPLFIRTWKKLYKDIDVIIILISNDIPEKFDEYKEHIILFEPIENVLTSFTSQYIRLLYPCILNYTNGILITDIDMIPLNKDYFTKNIEKYDNEQFIYYRENVMFNKKQIAICYNAALSKIWRNIFTINTLEDVKYRLTEVFNSNVIKEGHGNVGWSRDQLDLYKYVMLWNKKTNNLICLKEKDTKFKRLDRNRFKLDNRIIENIKKGVYTDYHCYRPMNIYSEINNNIYNLLE